MKQTTGREDWAPFQEDMLKVVCVFKLDVEELACKIHLLEMPNINIKKDHDNRNLISSRS